MRWLQWVPPAVLVLVFGGMLWLNQGVSRVFILSADTRGASVGFDGRDAWFLGPAQLCLPRETPLRRAPEGAPPAFCDPRLYQERQEPSLTVEWSAGAEVAIRHEGDRVLLVPGGAGGPFPAGTVIAVSAASLAQQGALTFAGTMRIGEAMGPGTRGFLVSGGYKVRESSRLSDWFGRRSDLVKTGELTRGDVASVVRLGGGVALASGFGQILAGDEGHVHAVFQSAAAPAAIRIEALGVQAAIIEPDWIDTLLASPYLLVAGLFLGLLANLVSLCFQVMDRFRQDPPGRS